LIGFLSIREKLFRTSGKNGVKVEKFREVVNFLFVSSSIFNGSRSEESKQTSLAQGIETFFGGKKPC